jgi:hypothetical protein
MQEQLPPSQRMQRLYLRTYRLRTLGMGWGSFQRHWSCMNYMPAGHHGRGLRCVACCGRTWHS